MSDEPQQLPAPTQPTVGGGFIPLLVFFGAFALLLIALLPGPSAETLVDLSVADKPDEVAAEIETDEPNNAEVAPMLTYAENARIQFVEPQDGQEVGPTFTAVFQAVNVMVEPAGDLNDNAGHFHVLINVPFIEPGEVIPNDDDHRHFGDGSLSTELTLSPGEHMLRLQFADGAHRALDGDQFRHEITIIVVEE